MLIEQPIRNMAEGLIAAAKNGNFDSVFSLLQQGCSVEAHDKDNATPLYWGACLGYAPVCEVLIQAGSDVNARVKWGSTALHAAADRGHLSCVAVLTQSGANVNSQNNRGDTPLHIAAYRGFPDITKALLKAGTDIAICNEKGKTPHEEAFEGGHKHVADCIKRHTTEERSQRTQLSPSLSYNITNDMNNHVEESPVMSSGSSGSLCSTTTSGSTSSSGSSMDPELKKKHGSRNGYGVNGYAISKERDNAKFSQTPLCRSMSVEAQDAAKISRLQHLAPPGQLPYRASSVGSIAHAGSGRNCGYNDVNRTYSSNELVSWPPSLDIVTVPNGVPTCVKAISCNDDVLRRPPKLASLSSNGQCVVTACTDYSGSPNIANDGGYGIENVHCTLRQFHAANRPNRSSIGSIREITGYHESQDDFVKTLQTQLVESYRHVEKLTKENENLKFKCSTLLNRLTGVERQHEEKKCESDHLRGLIEAYGVELEKRDTIIRTLKGGHVTSMGQREIAVKKAGQQDEDYSMQKLEDLQAKLRNYHPPQLPDQTQLDAPHMEWFPDDDYVIRDAPISSQSDDELTEFLSFHIKHKRTEQEMILKVLFTYTSRTGPKSAKAPTISSDASCLFGKQQEFRTIPILHHYIGRTDYFKKFVSIPKSLSNTVEIADWAAFIVTPRLMTLNMLITSHRNTSFPLDDTFLSHAMYQLTSSLCDVEEKGYSCGNINVNTILFDAEMRLVLDNTWVHVKSDGNSGQARGDSNGQSNGCLDVFGLSNGRNGVQRWRRVQEPFSRTEVNSNLLHLLQLFDAILTFTNGGMFTKSGVIDRTNDTTADVTLSPASRTNGTTTADVTPSPASRTNGTTTADVTSLLAGRTNGTTTADVTPSPTAHTNGTIPGAHDEDVSILAKLRQIVQKSISGSRGSTCSVRDIRDRLGCCLFGPRNGTVTNVQDCRRYIRPSVENYLSQHSESSSLTSASHDVVSVYTLVQKQTIESASDFWCSITPEALLDACRFMEG